SGAAYVITNTPYAFAGLEIVQGRVDGSNAILAWAAGGSTAPTVQQYKDAGIDNVTIANLADINSQIQSLAHTDMANVQPMVDAINKILAFTADATNPEPTDNDYSLAGITNVTAENLALLNVDVGDEALTLPEIQLTADQVTHLVLIRSYSQDSSNAEPTLDNYTGANITDPRAENVADYNSQLADSGFALRSEFEGVVNALNLFDDHAAGTASSAPSWATYAEANLPEIDLIHVAILNQRIVADQLTTVASVNSTILSLHSLNAFVFDDQSTAPALTDFVNLGVTDVDANNLNYVNSLLQQDRAYGFTHFFKSSLIDANQRYGWSVSLSDDGNTMVVLGKQGESVSGDPASNKGRAFVYRKNGSSWRELAQLATEQNTDQSHSVKMSANGARIVIFSAANAYVFDAPIIENQPDWQGSISTVTITLPDSVSTTSEISAQISPDGSTIAVGDRTENSSEGKVTIYREVSGTWAVIQTFIGPEVGSVFGYAVDMSTDGNVIAIGAYDDIDNGSVIVYRHDGTLWQQEQRLFASNPGTDDYFGNAVSITRDGTRIAIGSDFEDGETNSINNQGAAYIFDFDGNAWSERTILRASDAAATDAFGKTLRLSPDGDIVLVGSMNAEAVYRYDLTSADASQWQSSEFIFASLGAFDDEFGYWGMAFNGRDIAIAAFDDKTDYSGIVTDLDGNGIFDGNDASSTGTSVDFGTRTTTEDGAVYFLTGYVLADTTAIQARVDAVNLILAWASGGSTAPSLSDYSLAAIDWITESNLDDANGQLQILAHTDMANIQPMVDSINVIQAYASDNTEPSPTSTDYVTAGISGVSAANLTDVNGQVDSQSLTPMASVQTMVDSFNVIQTYATDNTQPAPSEADFTNIGVTGVTALNLADVNAQVNAQTLTATATIQTVVSSFTLIEAYAADNTQTAPSETDFTNIGVTGVTASNLSDINGQVDSQSLSSTASVQTVVDSHNRIATFAADNTQTAPDVADYTNIGVSGVDIVNLSEVNQQVDAQSLSTIANVQIMVTSLNVIESYAADNTQTAPSTTDYANIGVTGVSANNLADVNAQVDSQSLSTIANVQTLVSSLNVIEAYALDNSQPAPSETDFINVGVSGVSAANLADVNAQVDGQSLSTLASVQTMVDGINAVLAWAVGGITEPTEQQYLDAGVTGVTATNLDDTNLQLQILAHSDMASVQAMADAINIVLAYTNDATNPAPTDSDYLVSGITNVNADNLVFMNEDVADDTLTMAQIQLVADQLSHLVLIRDYSLDSSNT
ncbi:hypothetical protein UB34_20410, partial [Photobacterium leiognathi]|uniref:FG-GAP repeat protein n=1 Tax=Photobacterium leiognathi TaxID=553611 RepID=UPI0005D3844D